MDTAKPKKPFYKRWWVWVIAVFVLLIVIGSSGGGKTATTETTAQTDKTATSQPSAAQKQYVEIAKFSGDGAKKSEPFTVTGDRFKISYDCSGDPSATLCTAFVFKVGSPYPQGVMNATHATKDETIIYTSLAGKGEYYLDANVMGHFTMTVYDYK